MSSLKEQIINDTEYHKFFKEKIYSALFSYEIIILEESFKLLNTSFEGYFISNMETIKETDNSVEFDVLALPKLSFIDRRIEIEISGNQQHIDLLDNFDSIVLQMNSIIVEWFIQENEYELAIELNKYTLSVIDKIEIRFMSKVPDNFQFYADKITKQNEALEKLIPRIYIEDPVDLMNLSFFTATEADWEFTDKAILKEISRELKTKGYTEKIPDFENVFEKKQIVNWLKEQEYLVYLIHQLATNYKLIKARKRAYFKLAEKYFWNRIDTVPVIYQKDSFKKKMHNINNSDPEKYSVYKRKMDIILKDSIKK